MSIKFKYGIQKETFKFGEVEKLMIIPAYTKPYEKIEDMGNDLSGKKK